MHLLEKEKAIHFRKKGMSYSEILNHFPRISKGTISRWLNSVSLTPSQLQIISLRIQKRVRHGIVKSAEKLREKKKARLVNVYSFAKKKFHAFQNDPLFVGGVFLYWAEGAKTTERVQFMNSDPRLIAFMMHWFDHYLEVPKEKMRARLFIHKIYAHEKHEQFWKTIIRLPNNQFLRTIYKPTPHKIKKNPSYRGCIRIDAGGVNEFHMIKSWEEMLAEKFASALVV